MYGKNLFVIIILSSECTWLIIISSCDFQIVGSGSDWTNSNILKILLGFKCNQAYRLDSKSQVNSSQE